MTTNTMPRKKVSFRLDERVVTELNSLVGDGSVNQFVEGLLFEFLKSTGRLPVGAERLPDNRGGSRPGSGKPKGYRAKPVIAPEPTQDTKVIEEEILDPG